MVKDGRNIYLNIRVQSPIGFESKSDEEKNRIRLDVIHSGLLKIAERDNKLDVHALQTISEIILRNKFSFEFTCKSFENKKNISLLAKLLVFPQTHQLTFYVQIEKNGQLKCKVPIYNGIPTGFYIPDLFMLGKWENENHFILTGRKKQVEIHILVNECEAKFINLTPFDKAPFFEMFRSDISPEEKETAWKNYEQTIPPHIRGIMDSSKN